MKNTRNSIQIVSERLSEEFQRVVPLFPEKPQRKKQPNRSEIQIASEAALKTFYEVARLERTKHRLGVFARARVAFNLQQRLLNAGYPSPLVKQVLFAMLLSVFVGDKE